MEMFDTCVATTLKIDSDGKVISSNVAVTFDIHEAEAHSEADVANSFQTFSVAADWHEDAEQSNLVQAMRGVSGNGAPVAGGSTPVRISKSKLVAGVQCLKRLYW
jgi:hypothetical protein